MRYITYTKIEIHYGGSRFAPRPSALSAVHSAVHRLWIRLWITFCVKIGGLTPLSAQHPHNIAPPDISSSNVNGVQMGALCPTKDITARPVANASASQQTHKLPRSFPSNLPVSNLSITKRYRADGYKIPIQWVSLLPAFFCYPEPVRFQPLTD